MVNIYVNITNNNSMIRTKFTDSEMIETLTNANPKPVAYSGQAFNFIALNDRVFEILLYQIFKARIETNDYTLNDKYDSIVLMQGVGERGRDCFLTKKGKNVGVIQCKQINKNLTKPEVLKEILKFILHYTQDKLLISDINQFTYYLAVSKGFAETANNFIADFNNNYSEKEIEIHCNNIIASYASFKEVNYPSIAQEVKNVFEKIKVKTLQPSDLSQYLFEHEKLIKSFFRVLTVTDNTLLEGIIENYLSPILSKVYNKKDRSYIDFTFRFKEYLQRVYSYYSSSRTLVFGNQQKKLDDFYYPLNLECIIDTDKEKKLNISTLQYEDNFLPEFKKIIIVDNGGMGKSTIMKWLFLSVIKQRKGIPIFIELRKLKDKKTIIDEIIQELNPIDENIEREVVTKLISQGNFIFFLDGYDEISDEDREFVTIDLQTFISKSVNNLFIMTSRPETALNTFSDFKEFKVKKLLKKEAFELIKKIGNNSDKSLRLIKKIEENDIQNIDDFLQSPLLVSLLYKKFEHRENIPLHLQEFYYDVFEALFQDHDLTKGDSYIRNKKTKLSFTEFFQVLRELGFYTLKKGEIEYNDAILTKYLQEISKRLPNIKFKPYDFIDDLVKAVPLFNKEGLQYRWSHKSFQEYFAAEFICRDSKDKQIDILQTMLNSSKAEKYVFVFNLCYDIDYKSFREALIIPYLREFISFYENKLLELGTIKNLDKDQIDIRKAIIFNKAYLVIPNGKIEHLNSIMDAIDLLKNDKDGLKLKGYPDFMPKNFRIKLISFGEVIIISSIRRNDLLELLVKKKSQFITHLKPKKNQLTIKKVFGGRKIPDSIVINDTVNDSNNTTSALIYFNALIFDHINNGNNQYLDYKKCKKYISEYEKEISKTGDDYFLSGF